MSRYVLKFRKFGYVKYISHLDLLRVFKRTFKKQICSSDIHRGSIRILEWDLRSRCLWDTAANMNWSSLKLWQIMSQRIF